jgi:hypothetical protein
MTTASPAPVPRPNDAPPVPVLRWTARVLSLLALGVVATFVMAEGPPFWRFAPRELMLFVCFPLGVCAGLALAWKWEGIGGSLTVASFASFYLVHWLWSHRFPSGIAFFVLALPGFLFLLCRIWTLASNRRLAG